MTPEAQRIAIAEACGWKYTQGHMTRPWKTGKRGRSEHRINPPDYLNDLNACHEMECILTPKGQIEYAIMLETITPSLFTNGFDTIHATAAQRAETFLKTIGKWDNGGKEV